MTRIIMCGCNGKMGRVISQIVKEDAEAEIVAGIDISGEQLDSYPVFQKITECEVEADAVIDFSSPAKLSERLAFAIEKKMPMVFCTTGLSEEEFAQVNEASKKVLMKNEFSLEGIKKNAIYKNEEIYGYMHDILGARVIDVFDLKYDTDEENNEKRIAHSSTRRAIFLSLQFLSLQKSEGQHPVPAFLNFSLKAIS